MLLKTKYSCSTSENKSLPRQFEQSRKPAAEEAERRECGGEFVFTSLETKLLISNTHISYCVT